MWGYPRFEPGLIELIVPRSRSRRPDGAVVHWLGPLPPADVTVVDAVPVTTPARTLMDIAATCPLHLVEEAFDHGLRTRLVTLPGMRRRLRMIGRRPGVAAMRALVAARAGGRVPESVFETRLLRLLRRRGLPVPVGQHEIRDGGRVVARVDFAYPELKLAIEADGFRYHSGRIQWDRDRSRRNALTGLGWRVVHVTWTEMLGRPDGVVDAIERARKT
jgi:very-short-patch-repair endonuclease